MRVFVCILLSFCFTSCNQDNSEAYYLKNRIMILGSRIDSPEQKIQLLTGKQTPTISKKKTTKANNKKSVSEKALLNSSKE